VGTKREASDPSHPLDSRLEPLRKRRSRRLQGPDATEWRLEIERNKPEWLAKCFPEAALVFANNGYGDHLYLLPDTESVMVFWHEGHSHEVYCARVEDLLPGRRRPPSRHGPISYFGTNEVVQLGDRVFVKYWLLFSGQGTVTYVPGISNMKRELERDGLAWVRASLDKGVIVDTIVIDGILKKSTTLISRKQGAT